MEELQYAKALPSNELIERALRPLHQRWASGLSL